MTDPVLDWAESGAMALSGARDGPPLLPSGAPTDVLREAFADLPAQARLDLTVLGERAAVAGFDRNAPWAPGGSMRCLPARDGWLAVSLARPSDAELVAALVEAEVGEPWQAVREWAAGQPAVDAAARAQLLGLPVAAVGEITAGRAPVIVTPGRTRVRRRDRPLVVDLSSLWAGPLCAHLLGGCGARVIKVESASRPDGARRGPTAFYDLLQAGHETVALDLRTDVAVLGRLLAAADVVIEASRPRALQALGIDAPAIAEAGTVWVSITAYGREQPMRVGFGDDVAAAAGLVCRWDGAPVPAGDALADPLTGVVAAAAAWRALGDERGSLLDISMAAVAADAARRPTPDASVVGGIGETWEVRTGSGRAPVRAPTARQPLGTARGLGADTAAVLQEFAR